MAAESDVTEVAELTSASLKAAVVTPGKLEELYTIGAQLGAGGYASVKKGTVKATGQAVAIKIFDPKLSLTDEKMAVRLLFEVVALRRIASLRHPNLAGFLAAHEDDIGGGRRRFSIIAPLYTGGELFDRIVARGHYSERDAAVLFAPVCHAVATLHTNGIWHRDLKPENIMMATKADDAPPIVCDFGFTRLPDYPDLHADARIGTYAYMAPEIWLTKTYGAAVDVFALGVLLYIMLSGFPPFWVEDERDRAGLMDQIINGRFSFDDDAWLDVSGAAKALIAGMLEVEPSGRLTMEDVLRHSWFTAHAPECVKPLAAAHTNLRRFNATRKLRAAARAVAWGGAMRHTAVAALRDAAAGVTVTPAQLRAMRDAFNRAAGAECTLNKDAFRAVMTELECSELPLDRVFEVFDRDASGTCDFRELLAGFASMQREGSEEALRAAFDIYDADGSGYLTLDELFRVLVAADLTSPAAAAAAAAAAADGGADGAHSAAAAAAPALRGAAPSSHSSGYGLSDAGEALAYRLAVLFHDIDRDHNGKVSFEEFKDAIKREPLLADVIFRNTRALPAAAAAAAAEAAGSAAAAGGAGGSAST